MKIKTNALLLLVSVLMICLSCNKESAPDYLQTTGEVVCVERAIETFTEIEVYHKIDLILSQDTIDKVQIEAGKNLIPDITTEVTDGKLVIKNTNKYNFLRSYEVPITIRISFKKLHHLIYRGAGNVYSTNTIVDSVFNFDSHKGTGNIELNVKAEEGHFNIHTGQCDLTLHGVIGVNYVYHAGNGYVNTSDLQTGYTFVTNKGTNDMKISVDHVLFARISYLGNIYYKGNPSDVATEITDQGQLIKID